MVDFELNDWVWLLIGKLLGGLGLRGEIAKDARHF
jgi:hypothetical protein